MENQNLSLITNHMIISAENHMLNKNFATAEDVISLVLQSFNKGTPFSLVRIGDGEGRIIGFDEVTSWSEVMFILRTWFGEHADDITEDQIFLIRNGILEALGNSSALGLPRVFSQRKNAKSVACAILGVPLKKWRSIELKEEVLVHASIHKGLEKVDFIRRLNDGGVQDFRTIGCHNVVETILSQTDGTANCLHFPVPGEKRFVDNGDVHYPDRFVTLLQELEFEVRSGQVWLVGAGGLGKIYCEKIRSLGGIALDIGSIFDLWAGLGSRGFIRSRLRNEASGSPKQSGVAQTQ